LKSISFANEVSTINKSFFFFFDFKRLLLKNIHDQNRKQRESEIRIYKDNVHICLKMGKYLRLFIRSDILKIIWTITHVLEQLNFLPVGFTVEDKIYKLARNVKPIKYTHLVSCRVFYWDA